MMVFNGQSHQAALLSHIQSAGPTQYDSLLMVNREGVNEYCLIVSLESEAAGQPLKLVIYTEKGRQELAFKDSKPLERKGFLPVAFFIVEGILRDRLQMPVSPQSKPPIEEKPLKEFYPDANQRLKLHYHFSHRWLPAYAKSDPARFFGYFQRGEQEPTKFIQARWQIMEQELKLIPPPPPGQIATVIRRVSDLQMWVDITPLAQPVGEGGQRPGEGVSRYPLAVVQMPDPEFITHAYYVGIILVQAGQPGTAPAKPEARVFTLEKIEDSSTEGRLCEWSFAEKEITHRNYGTQVRVAREDFIKAMFAKIEEPVHGRYSSTTFQLGTANAGAKQHNGSEALTGIRCPKCAWIPTKSSRWSCTCLHIWNTFDTRGKCPKCNRQWTETACPACKQMSPHEAWYVRAE